MPFILGVFEGDGFGIGVLEELDWFGGFVFVEFSGAIFKRSSNTTHLSPFHNETWILQHSGMPLLKESP